jgi:hypothetical protein
VQRVNGRVKVVLQTRRFDTTTNLEMSLHRHAPPTTSTSHSGPRQIARQVNKQKWNIHHISFLEILMKNS